MVAAMRAITDEMESHDSWELTIRRRQYHPPPPPRNLFSQPTRKEVRKTRAITDYLDHPLLHAAGKSRRGERQPPTPPFATGDNDQKSKRGHPEQSWMIPQARLPTREIRHHVSVPPVSQYDNASTCCTRGVRDSIVSKGASARAQPCPLFPVALAASPDPKSCVSPPPYLCTAIRWLFIPSLISPLSLKRSYICIPSKKIKQQSPFPLPLFVPVSHRVVFPAGDGEGAHGQQICHPQHLPHAICRVSPPRFYEDKHRQRRKRRVPGEEQVPARAEVPDPVAFFCFVFVCRRRRTGGETPEQPMANEK